MSPIARLFHGRSAHIGIAGVNLRGDTGQGGVGWGGVGWGRMEPCKARWDERLGVVGGGGGRVGVGLGGVGLGVGPQLVLDNRGLRRQTHQHQIQQVPVRMRRRGVQDFERDFPEHVEIDIAAAAIGEKAVEKLHDWLQHLEPKRLRTAIQTRGSMRPCIVQEQN